MNDGLTLHTAAVCERVIPWRLRSVVRAWASWAELSDVRCIFCPYESSIYTAPAVCVAFCPYEDTLIDGLGFYAMGGFFVSQLLIFGAFIDTCRSGAFGSMQAAAILCCSPISVWGA